MPATAAYVYCIVKSSRKPSLSRVPRGLPGAAAPQARDAGRGLWCVLAQVPLETYGPEAVEPALSNMAWVSDVALAHEAVVEHFARQRGVTTVPMKLLTMFATPERAVADVQARRRRLEAVARRIGGCEEWGVRIARGAGPRPATKQERPATGAAFLEARKRARDEARDAARAVLEVAEEAFERLDELAEESSRRRDAPPGATAPPLVDAAFLVRAPQRARFKAAARQAAAACEAVGAEMTLTGPWPAYNFIGHDTGART
jgi:hypothetical protein